MKYQHVLIRQGGLFSIEIGMEKGFKDIQDHTEEEKDVQNHSQGKRGKRMEKGQLNVAIKKSKQKWQKQKKEK